MKNEKAMNRMMRMMRAMLDGWVFGAIRLRPFPSRNCIFIWKPVDEGFRAHKSDGKHWLNKVLDSAGVPK